METKISSLLSHFTLLTVLVFVSCCATKPSSLELSLDDDVRYGVKEVALCRCLNFVYPSFDSLYNDGSAGGFQEYGNFDYEQIDRLDSLIVTYFKNTTYRSAFNQNLGLLKCVDFNKSKLMADFEHELSTSKK